MMKILIAFVNAVRRFCKERSVKLSIGHAAIDMLEYNHGVIQGKALSALLYILSVNHLLFCFDEISQSETGVPKSNLA